MPGSRWPRRLIVVGLSLFFGALFTCIGLALLSLLPGTVWQS